MSKELPPPQPSDEVDLGQLFRAIGNAFDRFFRFIGNIFKAIFDVFLLLLIHIYKRLKWYVAVMFIGLVLGYFIDKYSPYLYGANMQIETNYNSSRQVYENINYLNQLAKTDRDSVELGKRLHISTKEAASIKEVTIKPNIDENDKMKLFSDFRNELDSLTRSTFTYTDYVDGLTSYSFSTHQIVLKSTNKFIFPKINASLVKELSDNPFLNEMKEVAIDNLIKKEKILENQKGNIDSLKTIYLAIRKTESEKQESKMGSGSNFFLGNSENKQNLIVDETKLVERMLELEEEKLQVYSDLVDKKYVIKVISAFPAAGYDVGKMHDKMIIKLPALLIAITLLIFIGLGARKYIEKEEKRLLNRF